MSEKSISTESVIKVDVPPRLRRREAREKLPYIEPLEERARNYIQCRSSW